MLRKIWKIKSLKYIAAFLIPAIFVMLIQRWLDNDSWFILAEGRYLVTNGIHYTDVLTMHDNLSIVVQNYGFAAIFYLIYSALGPAGLYISMLALNGLICYLLYKICMLLSNKNVNLSLLIMMMTDLLLAEFNFVTTRPQMVSYVIFLSLICLLELYIKTEKTKYLWFIPLLSVLQINFHASLWWMLILVLIVYIIDSIKKPKWHLQGYKTKPLVIVSLVTILAGFLNPYGLKMITYIFTSYGAPEITQMVNEMKPFNLRTTENVLVYGALVLVLVLEMFGKKKGLRIRHLLMFFGFLALGLNTVKGMSQFIMVMFFPLALQYKNVRIERVIEAREGREALMFWTGVVSVCLFVGLCAALVPNIKDGPDDGVIGALDAIEEANKEKSKVDKEESGANKEKSETNEESNEVKVYVGYNNGGYVEFRGFKAYLDPRAEVFLKKNNQKGDILKEWEEMLSGDIKLDEFLEKYDFDYLIVDKAHESIAYDLEDESYRRIYENTDEEIRVFEKVGK